MSDDKISAKLVSSVQLVAPDRTVDYSLIDLRKRQSRFRLLVGCLLRLLLACVLGTIAGTSRAVVVFKRSGIELRKVFRHQVEDGMDTFVTYVVAGAVIGFLVGVIWGTKHYQSSRPPYSAVPLADGIVR